ncbi:bifunctional RNase H/acid phosphatase, partial [Georgenia sp. 10Sc9-8]|nr:bifunctional RNase H/acid phosphatase [Georgenia halotolerans]
MGGRRRDGGRRLVVETDGGSRGNPGPAGYGAVVRDAVTGDLLAERSDYLGVVSNNVAEYTGLVEGLRAAAEIDADAQVEVRADSKLIVEQMSGRWKIKHEDMRRLAGAARQVLPPRQVRYTWVPRAENTAADALANEAMDSRTSRRRDPWRESTAPGDKVAGPTAPGPVPVGAGAARPSGAALHRGTGDPVTLVLVRHGVTPLTEAGRYSGGDTPGPGLSPLGQEQAQRAATLVGRIGADVWPDLPAPTSLLASPLVRTQETAGALATALGLTPTEDAAFAEVRFGEWDGLRVTEIEERHPGELRRWATEDGAAPAGGESLREVADRVTDALRRLAQEEAGRTVIVATHTVVVRAAVGVVGRMPQPTWPAVRIPPASVTILRLWPDDDLGPGELTAVGCPS